ncbi:hypothetical protein D8674_021393 [Pyrus ussuriensis x Pyrus communis]|uniref:Uncharacterized protein n=1 Tax=Pyrus ussuriensis x Pyrus communis TaxID=2448454 RepID=A0A5N5GH13_9ROSA|nr:hypothetical protein D8674_021393 [Pyrus ussuriensis x Pyrus communis]
MRMAMETAMGMGMATAKAKKADEADVFNYDMLTPMGSGQERGFTNLSDLVEGVLGKTYRPGYGSPVKVGVPMPMVGGEDKYETSSLFSPFCKVCRFQKQPEVAAAGGIAQY